MNETVSKIHDSRIDLSDYLFHFTKRANAKSTLEKILSDGKIKDVNGKGVICFTEAPLPVLPDMFDIFAKYPDPLYAPYGIGIKKEELFYMGGRPVIYGLPKEKELLDASIQWRFQEYDPKEDEDFAWLREWRINSPEVILDNTKHFVITPTNEDFESILEYDNIKVDGCTTAEGEFWPYYTLNRYRDWNAISIELIRDHSIKTRKDIQLSLDVQNTGLQDSIPLGSGY